MIRVKLFIKDEEVGDLFLTNFVPRIGELISFETKSKGRIEMRINDLIWFLKEDLIHIRGIN